MMQFTFNNMNSSNNMIKMQFGKTDRQNLNQLTKAVYPSTDVVISNQEEKKMAWGEPIWFLFHTLAQKVKDDSFAVVRVELLNYIFAICANLPCPVCSNHAIEYLNKINFNTITSKNQLIKTIYAFHNDVNKRKNVPLFNYDDVESKYSKAITINIIQYFMSKYETKNINVRMLANEFHKKKLVADLKTWFNANIQYFDS